ncbi:MAG: hypothetical protein B6A08_16080 [Sorangiineae bacterium NIC37A_2]|jgi:hypothetical protein|nr:MAG: hypothetical protein B6A08_16080 [Sorangiineae bacterium NIC37A_2]
MAGDKKKTAVCASCGFSNKLPLDAGRCVSCGARMDDGGPVSARASTPNNVMAAQSFNLLWFAIAIGVMVVLTGAIVVGLPAVIPALDFEGSAGMMVAIPVWFVGGMLVGLISPGRTFTEPAVAVFLVALPTAFILYSGQTVRTMPAFMYVLFSALGVLFSLIGAYVGERLQMSGQ